MSKRKSANWGEIDREFAGGRGVDHVVAVGGPATFNQLMAAARVGANFSDRHSHRFER